jgi:hypothetical protein
MSKWPARDEMCPLRCQPARASGTSMSTVGEAARNCSARRESGLAKPLAGAVALAGARVSSARRCGGGGGG